MTRNEPATNPNNISRVAVGMAIIKGEIIATHDIRFDGDFDGKITSKGRIIVGETAHLSGEVICANLDVWGNFDGTATVKDTSSFKAGSVVKGTINTGNIVVELGSRLEGETKMISEDAFNKSFNESEFSKYQASKTETVNNTVPDFKKDEKK